MTASSSKISPVSRAVQAAAAASRLVAQAPRVCKPWFVYRPQQVLRRAHTIVRAPSPGYRRLRTSWGIDLFADPTSGIGQSILRHGVHDLTVSELLARLIGPGDSAIDAGAGVGYMTLLAAVAAGPRGRVLAFEPHPTLFALADENVHAARDQCAIAPVEFHNVAIGEREDEATLVLPDGAARGAASILTASRALAVPVRLLDDVLGKHSARVLNLAVEGFELPALRGARAALEAHRIGNIVFEDRDPQRTEVLPFLRTLGYHIYSVTWSIRGLSLAPVEPHTPSTTNEPTKYLASVEPGYVFSRCRTRGWTVLSDVLIRREAPRAPR
jgi:FkbM family methyltransferase